MMDLMYFGFENGMELKKEFEDSILEIFTDIKLISYYDDIHGYREEVYLLDEQRDNYLAWILGNGWLKISLSLQVLSRDKRTESELKNIAKLAGEQYPNAF